MGKNISGRVCRPVSKYDDDQHSVKRMMKVNFDSLLFSLSLFFCFLVISLLLSFYSVKKKHSPSIHSHQGSTSIHRIVNVSFTPVWSSRFIIQCLLRSRKSIRGISGETSFRRFHSIYSGLCVGCIACCVFDDHGDDGDDVDDDGDTELDSIAAQPIISTELSHIFCEYALFLNVAHSRRQYRAVRVYLKYALVLWRWRERERENEKDSREERTRKK